MFVTRLPDPSFRVNAQGREDPYGLPVPGFKGINLTSKSDRELIKARSKRTISVSRGGHEWEFTIQYNPMTEEQRRALEAFIYGHNIFENPFYVVLPNFSKPSGPMGNLQINDYKTTQAYESGTSIIEIKRESLGELHTPQPGDMFDILESGDFLHQNVYKVAWVETPLHYNTSAPAANTIRLHIFPSLQRDVDVGSHINFINPKFRVITSEANLSTSFDAYGRSVLSLGVEEAQP